MLALAQLNRATEKEQRRPRPSDIRDSGQVEQDADLVAFLCKGDETPQDAVDFYIAKQRNGTMGPLPLAWRPEFTRFDNYPLPQQSY